MTALTPKRIATLADIANSVQINENVKDYMQPSEINQVYELWNTDPALSSCEYFTDVVKQLASA